MTQEKKGFGSKLGFILAAAGSAVGLGNIWRFPYLVAQFGGAAFVLVYLISVFLIGTVVMIGEMYLGKRTKSNVIDAYGSINKHFKWIGMLCVIVPFIISSYYAVVGGWATGFTVNYLFNGNFTTQSATDNYFANFIGSNGNIIIPILFTMLFLALSLIIVGGGVQKGIEKASKILMPSLLLILIVIAIKVLTLGKGVSEGLNFYLGTFDFKALGWSGVVAGMGQAFFSMSLGMGIMIAYGAYTKKGTNLGKSALIISCITCVVALLIGLIIFPAIYAFDSEIITNTAGETLLFVVMPKIFATMSGGRFFGFLFFGLVVFAAITSVISTIEVVSQYAISKHNIKRKKATLICGLLIGILAIFIAISKGFTNFNLFGFDLLTYFDEITNTILMPLLAFSACITIGWIIKPKSLFLDFKDMETNFKFQKFWYFLAKFISPALILVILILGIIGKFNQYSTPTNGESLNFGFVMLGASILIVASIVWNLIIDSKKFNSKSLENK